MENQTQRLDLEAIREKLAGKSGKQYWKGLEEVADTEQFRQWVDDEFPNRRDLLNIDRRSFLKVMGASMALAGLSGCRGVFLDQEKVVPYVKQPEELTLGKPLYYASAVPMAGYGIGVLVEQHEGRPTKIEGNPDHPESLGATNPWMQASILGLYDPDRSQSVRTAELESTWDEFFKVARGALHDQLAQGGAGVRILTEAVASPFLADQMAKFLASYPAAKWHAYDPLAQEYAMAGAQLEYGRPVNTVYDLSKANVILSLDSNFLQDLPGSLRYARDFADRRRVEANGNSMNRLYQIESFPNITGATADHRWAVRQSEIEAMAMSVLALVTGGVAAEVPGVPAEALNAIARDLQANRGASLVVPGEHLSPDVHMLCHRINAALGNVGSTVRYTAPLAQGVVPSTESLGALVNELNAGAVDLLLILGANPVYLAPGDMKVAEALQNAKGRNGKPTLKLHHGAYFDETAKLCDWHAPQTHFLEEWGDVVSYDGSVAMIQPLTAPLYGSKSHAEVLAGMARNPQSGYDLLRVFYRGRITGDFEKAWRQALHSGIAPGPAPAPLALAGSTAGVSGAHTPTQGIELLFRYDDSIRDGRYANNGWLQELPKPLTKITWDNAIHMSPALAQAKGVQSEDLVELQYNGQTVSGGVWIMPGLPPDTIVVHLGFGRKGVGNVAEAAGFNVNQMRKRTNPYYDLAQDIRKVGGFYPLAVTQLHNSMEGRDILRSGTLEGLIRDAQAGGHGQLFASEEPALHEENIEELSMYPDEIFDPEGLPQWGMTIDLNTCIGCNACVVACQAENNIPVVGKDQVKRSRELHWLRIDRYYEGDLDHPSETAFQPMMCVHCEKAPCEPVCPVAATVHSHEGLNQMIYNRCVGTRYCSNNCPYKVRRFNYLNYSDNQPQFMNTELTLQKEWAPGKITSPKGGAEHGIQLLRMVNNPDVTVRGRGIMEKCTYCVQRINDTRIEAKKQGRDIQDGEIITACQQACPTRTIVFGNVADPNSKVSKLRNDRRSYLVLRELQTRPRTSHLAKVRNLNPEIKA